MTTNGTRLAALAGKLKDAGLDVPELADTDYGMRDTSITDPWGHHLTFGEAVQNE